MGEREREGYTQYGLCGTMLEFRDIAACIVCLSSGTKLEDIKIFPLCPLFTLLIVLGLNSEWAKRAAIE